MKTYIKKKELCVRNVTRYHRKPAVHIKGNELGANKGRKTEQMPPILMILTII